MGFFTDTSVCIGCKACEVACKEWNEVPEDGFVLTGMSYDNTEELGARTWRHVAFVEKPLAPGQPVDLGHARASGRRAGADGRDQARRVRDGAVRWLMSSDVCKHCTHAACLDVCPTGALFRTEFGTVVVQPDVCNGCGYCVPACPYGVIDIRARTTAARSSARCATTGSRTGWSRPAPRPARPSPSSSASSTSCASGPQRRVAELHERGSTSPGSTAPTPTTASAGTARSSCCSTSPRSTGCRRTRW